MTTTAKLTLSSSRDIPLDKLRLSQANVRRVKAGVSIEDLAEDIARRTLLHGLSVRPMRDDSGNETGVYEVPAGGRRFRALQLLVKQKRLSKTAKIPCVVHEDGLAEEDSLAENTQREALHPLDQFRAFATLREKGLSDEDIAARFFLDVRIVRQRLKLAAASPKLLEAYAEDELNLEQLMAFCVTGDHARQESVWAKVKGSFNAEPYRIRQHLTEKAVRASDKRARYVGLAAYETAGGIVARDLFSDEDTIWLESVDLLDRLAQKKLEQAAEAVHAEGWKWVEVAPDFSYGHTHGLSRVTGKTPKPSKKDEKARKALEAEFDRLQESLETEDGEISEEIDRRLAEIEAALDTFDERRTVYAPGDVARAGAFVTLDASGAVRIERGYVRPEDEPATELEDGIRDGAFEDASSSRAGDEESTAEADATDGDEQEGPKPLSDRLLAELTQHRTLALREALANDPATAKIAVLHALCLALFYRFAGNSCLDIDAKSAVFGQPAADLNDAIPARAIDARHETWVQRLPDDAGPLWDTLLHLDGPGRDALLAHCAGMTVNAVQEPWNRRPGALAHADQLARSLGLDMARAGWRPTAHAYLGRVTKAHILEAVREVHGTEAAERLAHLKKADMAREAEGLLDGSGWLPEPLRTPAAGEDVMATAAEPGFGGKTPPEVAEQAR